MNTHKLYWMGLAMAVALTAPLRAATVTPTLDPAEISLGDSTQLTVTVSGSQEQPTVPNVDGLVIQSVSQGTQISIVNGSMTSSASVTYQITPQRAGTFTIPALQAGGAKSEPITLQVAGQGGAVPPTPSPTAAQPQPATSPGAGPVVTPPNAPTTPDTVSTTAPGRFGSLVLAIPKTEFYEGELIPAEIKAILPKEVNPKFMDVPQFTNDGFTLNSLTKSQPDQTEETINGRDCYVLTWHTALTAVKSGDFTLAFTMPLTVVLAQQMPQMDDADAFNNIFRNPFAAAFGVQKEVKLASTPVAVKVLPLPTANRPADFGGAVGTFEADASASPDKVTAGDPVTLKLKISGAGNFDRVASDMLPSDSNWKTYSPKAHLDPLDSVGYQGTKTFEQPIIANNGSVTSVPSLSFSFFDPEKRDYTTITTPPIPISVSGAPAAPAPAATLSQSPSVAPANPVLPPAPVYAASDLRMNRIESGTFVSTLEPVYLNPLFVTGQALPLVALLGGLAFLRRRERMLHPDRARLTAAQAAIRKQVNAMDAAMRDGQAEAFFVHARNALQQRYGQQWKMRPEAITVNDLEARLGAESANVRSIFEMADQASYSDLHFGEADLQKWREVVVTELAETK